MNTLTLTYFPARGTCDKIRLVLVESGLNYVEKNVTGAEFGVLKKQLRFKTLPMLEEGSLVLFHSNAILRYVADKAGLYGRDSIERAECDMWAEQCELIQQTLWNAEFMKYSEIERQSSKIEEMRNQFYKKELKPLLNEIIAHLSSKEFPYLVGQRPMYDVLDIKNVKVKRKTEELMRLLDLRAAGGLRGGNNCKYTACLHLACKLIGEAFDLEKALRSCGVSSQVYTDTYSTVSSILELAPPVPFEEICVKFGVPEIAKPSKRVLEKYKELFVKGLPENRRADVRFDRNVFTVAAFFLTAEYKRKKIDKKKLLEYAGVTYADFDSIHASMDELIFAPIRAEEEAEKKALQEAKKASDAKKAASAANAKAAEDKKTGEKKADDKDTGAEKAEKKEKTTASELSLNDENKENKDQNIKGKKRGAPKLTVNELLSLEGTTSIVNEDLFKKELDDTFDVDVENEPDAPITRIERKKRKRDEYEQWKEKVLQDSNQVQTRKTKQAKLQFASNVSSKGENAKEITPIDVKSDS